MNYNFRKQKERVPEGTRSLLLTWFSAHCAVKFAPKSGDCVRLAAWRQIRRNWIGFSWHKLRFKRAGRSQNNFQQFPIALRNFRITVANLLHDFFGSLRHIARRWDRRVHGVNSDVVVDHWGYNAHPEWRYVSVWFRLGSWLWDGSQINISHGYY